MRMSKVGAIVISVGIAHCLVMGRPARGGFVPLVTQDALQPGPNSQDDFEEVLTGNKTSLFTGQFLNAFPAPNSVSVQFDAPSNTTTVSFVGPPTGPPISPDQTAYNTFGYAINAISGPIINPGNKDGYWTPGIIVPGHVPEQNIMALYTPASHQVQITITNDPGTIILSGVGYLVTNVPFALTSLNRTTLPPTAFLPSTVPDGTTLAPGESTSFTISGVNQGQYVTIFSDGQFSPTSGNAYLGESGQWLEFQAVPEPASWVLMVIGTATLMGGVASRRRVRGSTSTALSPTTTSG